MIRIGVWVALSLPLVATAQPGSEFQAGVDAFRLGKMAEAREHLKKAVEADPKLPGPHRFLGAVARAESKWDDCLTETRIAIKLNPASSEIGDTKKLYDECRAGAGRTPYKGELGDSAAIAVTTNIPGATVKIGGLQYGGTPLAPRPITAGELSIEIEKVGWKPAKVTADALAGIVTDVIVDLEPDPNAKPDVDLGTKPKATSGFIEIPAEGTTTLDGKPVSAGKLEQVPGTYTIEIRTPDHDPWRRRVRIVAGQTAKVAPAFVETAGRESKEKLGMLAISGGLALAAGGFFCTVRAHSLASDVRAFDRQEHTRAEFEDKVSSSKTYSTVSTILYTGSALAIVGGAIALYFGASQRTDTPAPYAVVPLEGGALIARSTTW